MPIENGDPPLSITRSSTCNRSAPAISIVFTRQDLNPAGAVAAVAERREVHDERVSIGLAKQDDGEMIRRRH